MGKQEAMYPKGGTGPSGSTQGGSTKAYMPNKPPKKNKSHKVQSPGK
jgi:hypothetical protein